MVIPEGENCMDPDLQSKLPIAPEGRNECLELTLLPPFSNLLLMLLFILPNWKPEGKGAYR